ncbi:MAG TPA: hypothetical protein DDW50_19695 [Firmicutes bacterium]|jgi:two-component system, chemotaxis family, sensor kinase CheA|nr:hypothetical protein [Bacillota bacterium]
MSQNKVNIDDSLTLFFITETHDQIKRFSKILLNWGQQEDPKKAVNELFRIAHNIKGSSGMMGLTELKDVAHLVEDLFDAVHKGKLKLDHEQIDSLLKFSDGVLLYIENGHWQEADWLKPWQKFFNACLTETL